MIKICKCNKLWFGIILGMILPMLTVVAFYNFAYHGNKGFFEFLSILLKLDSVGMLLAVSSLSNLAVFMIFVNINKLLIARGLVVSTVAYVLAVLFFKFAI